MNYYYDTEFLEGTQKTWFGQTKPTIDLISIGVVSEDGREYYAISKDFNLKEAWNRYDLVRNGFRDCGLTPNYDKVYWIRENVLKPIYDELINLEWKVNFCADLDYPFNYSSMKYLIKKYGKSNKQIAEEIKEFCKPPLKNTFIEDATKKIKEDNFIGQINNTTLKDIINGYEKINTPIQFYGYYSDYDHVALCWLFGKMIDLPKGFPMYTIDLKQILDEKIVDIRSKNDGRLCFTHHPYVVEYKDIKEHYNYPKQNNEHNALADAIWNKQLHEFLNNL